MLEGNWRLRVSWVMAMTLAFVGLGLPAMAQYDSPFGGNNQPSKPEAPKPQAPSRLNDLEFTGLFAVEGELTFSLYDAKAKRSLWVPHKGSEEGFTISGFDDPEGKITVHFGGQSREIAINENEIVTLKQPARVSPAPPRSNKPVAPRDPETVKKEEEAQAFVSNLLAGSMARREENRRKREEQIAAARRRAGSD